MTEHTPLSLLHARAQRLVKLCELDAPRQIVLNEVALVRKAAEQLPEERSPPPRKE